jgi:hypothetical protein
MKKLLLFSVLLCLTSCKNLSSDEKEIITTIGKQVNIEMFKVALNNNDKINMQKFRNKYKYIYLVYLQIDCMPCYMTYNNWQQEFSRIKNKDNVTILYIINGDSYNNFINEASKYGLAENDYYSVIDPNNEFIMRNNNISLSIIKKSILIDEKNKIRLIGSPFITPEMTKLFNTIISNDSLGN